MTNREIKFRAWDKKTKQICIVLETDFKSWVLLDTLKGKGLNQRKASEVIFMQFTGLKDKNGKEIYEGDILKCNTNMYGTEMKSFAIGEVVFEKGCFKWLEPSKESFYKDKSGKKRPCIEKHYLENVSFPYVIGNIYENKEEENDDTN